MKKKIPFQLIWQLALPITLVLFISFTQWRYVVVVDGTDVVLYGFPFSYTCWAFYTSMAQQYFLLEMALDFIVYLLAVSTLIFLIHRFVIRIALPGWTSRLSLTIVGAFLVIFLYFGRLTGDIFYMHRPFDYQLCKQGAKAIWQAKPEKSYEDCAEK